MSAAWSTTDTYRYINTVQTFLNSSSISELQIQPAPELLYFFSTVNMKVFKNFNHLVLLERVFLI